MSLFYITITNSCFISETFLTTLNPSSDYNMQRNYSYILFNILLKILFDYFQKFNSKNLNEENSKMNSY